MKLTVDSSTEGAIHFVSVEDPESSSKCHPFFFLMAYIMAIYGSAKGDLMVY